MKGNVINLNTLHLNSVRLNGIGKVQSVSLKGGSTEDPVFPPVEPPVEPEPTPTYTLSASVTNGMVSATRNGSAVNLPFTANEGDVIVVSVTPNDGYEFNGWADGNTDNPRSITMTADVALSAQCVEVVVPPVGNYIQFEDKAVEAICVANWSSDGIGLTEEDAAAVTDIGTAFKKNTEITSFNEFRYFTGVTTIKGGWDNGAFYGCTNLRTIQFPPHLSVINACAFQDCEQLDIVVNIPTLTNIQYGIFHNTRVSKIESLGTITTIPNAGKSDSYTCFGDNPNLKTARIPSSVSVIGIKAFVRCTGLEEIICEATTPPTLNHVNALYTNNCPIYVPDASVEAYKTATNWSTYASRIKGLSEYNG